MSNNKRIEKIVLNILEKNGGSCNWSTMVMDFNHDVSKEVAAFDLPIVTPEKFAHILYLMEKDNSVEKIEKGHDMKVWYKLTPWGHAKLSNCFKKNWHFIFYKKDHNFFALLALITSVISLIISVIVYYK